jgi:hypothetical protein
MHDSQQDSDYMSAASSGALPTQEGTFSQLRSPMVNDQVADQQMMREMLGLELLGVAVAFLRRADLAQGRWGFKKRWQRGYLHHALELSLIGLPTS